MTTAPAMTAAAGPNDRFTARKRTPTVPTPASASGSRTLHELRPKSRTERPMTIVESGGLSTVMKLAASNEPKNQADQLCDAGQRRGRVVGVGVAADGQVPDVQDGRQGQDAKERGADPGDRVGCNQYGDLPETTAMRRENVHRRNTRRRDDERDAQGQQAGSMIAGQALPAAHLESEMAIRGRVAERRGHQRERVGEPGRSGLTEPRVQGDVSQGANQTDGAEAGSLADRVATRPERAVNVEGCHSPHSGRRAFRTGYAVRSGAPGIQGGAATLRDRPNAIRLASS